MTKENPKTELNNELSKIEELRKLLDNEGVLYDENGEVDSELLINTIEGETNLHELILELEMKISEYDTMAKAIKINVDTLNKRKSRMQNSANTLRTIILSSMDKAGIKKIEGSLATISLKSKPRSLIITDESLIPSKYFESQPKLKKKDLISNLKDGDLIDGVELDNGGISLQIRKS